MIEEKIYHDAGATTDQFTPRGELERLIRAAGRIPVERDTLYNRIDRSKLPPVTSSGAGKIAPARDFIPETTLTLNT